jgi:hypothetical protein
MMIFVESLDDWHYHTRHPGSWHYQCFDRIFVSKAKPAITILATYVRMVLLIYGNPRLTGKWLRTEPTG